MMRTFLIALGLLMALGFIFQNKLLLAYNEYKVWEDFQETFADLPSVEQDALYIKYRNSLALPCENAKDEKFFNAISLESYAAFIVNHVANKANICQSDKKYLSNLFYRTSKQLAQKEQLADAHTITQMFVHINPRDPFARRNLAELNFLMGDFQAASIEYEELFNLVNGTSVKVTFSNYDAFAKSLIKTQRECEAAKIYGQFLSVNKNKAYPRIERRIATLIAKFDCETDA